MCKHTETDLFPTGFYKRLRPNAWGNSCKFRWSETGILFCYVPAKYLTIYPKCMLYSEKVFGKARMFGFILDPKVFFMQPNQLNPPSAGCRSIFGSIPGFIATFETNLWIKRQSSLYLPILLQINLQPPQIHRTNSISDEDIRSLKYIAYQSQPQPGIGF